MSGITAFPAASVLVSGQTILGKSTGGAGVCAELSPSDVRTLISAQPLNAALTALAGVTTAANKLTYATGANTFATTDLTAFARTILDDADAATVLSTIGAQAALVSGTNIKTINNQSLLGSGNITISGGGGGSPGGDSTQIQFNSSSAFAASPRLTWGETPGLGLVTTDPNAQLMTLSPPTGAAFAHNVPYVINGSVTDNTITGLAADVSAYNFVVNQGININAGGSLLNTNHPGIGQYFESNYITNRRGFNERLVEYHLIAIPSVSTTNWTSNNQIRFMSMEMLTGENAHTGAAQAGATVGITTYFTASTMHVAGIGTSFTEPWFAMMPGEFVLGNGTGGRITISLIGGLGQFSVSGGLTEFLFSRTVNASGDLIASARLRALSAENNAIITNGGIDAKKLILTLGSVGIVLNATEPDPVGGAMVFYPRDLGSVLTPHVRMGGDAAVPMWYSRRTSSAANPTTTQLPSANMMCVHTNTSNSKRFLAINDGGTIVGVELTAL